MTDELRRLRLRVEASALPERDRSQRSRPPHDRPHHARRRDRHERARSRARAGTGKELVAHALHERSKRKGAF